MIRIITDTTGDSGRLEVWPDTDDELVTDWLAAAFRVEEAHTLGEIDDDTAQGMRDAMEQVAAWATGMLRGMPWEQATFLGVRLDVLDEAEAVADAADALEAAHAALHEACRRAVACGATKVAVSKAAGITRSTLDAWLAEASR